MVSAAADEAVTQRGPTQLSRAESINAMEISQAVPLVDTHEYPTRRQLLRKRGVNKWRRTRSVDATSWELPTIEDATTAALDELSAMSPTIVAVSDRRITLQVLKAALKDCYLHTEDNLNSGGSEFGENLKRRVEGVKADLIILETMGRGGTCVNAAVKARQYIPNVPILCILTSVTAEDRENTKLISNAFILPKPFHTTDLRECIIGVMSCQEASLDGILAPWNRTPRTSTLTDPNLLSLPWDAPPMPPLMNVTSTRPR